MRQSSIVIHRGKKEEKYELYVEDYVISFLKEKEKTQEAKDILFYGRREKNGRQYTIYGAGADRHLAVFDKYELLEEVGCRLTGQDPVFLIREPDGIHEVAGYNVFYYDNTEMQDYLIQRDGREHKKPSARELLAGSGQKMPGGRAEQPAAQGGKAVRRTNPHYAVSLQLGLVFIVLVAIVINSANSYDKMELLNQSAEEVFFVMENQEAETIPAQTETKGREDGSDIVIRMDDLQDDLLQDSVERENARADRNDLKAAETAGTEQTSDAQEGPGQAADTQDGTEQVTGTQEGTEQAADRPADVQKASGQPTDAAPAGTKQDQGEEDTPQETAETGEGVEALSRNVARYYEIKRGDTLYMISQRIYGDTSHVKKICELNEISDPDDIHYGQKIILP